MSGHLQEAADRLAAARDEHRAIADRIDEVLVVLSGLGVEPEAATDVRAAAATTVASTPEPGTKAKAAKSQKGTGKPTGTHECPECDKSFNRPAGLTRHLRQTHGHEGASRSTEYRRSKTAAADRTADPAGAKSTPAGGHRCPVCRESFLTKGALSAHRYREDHSTDAERAAESDEPEAA